jgi:hypothetical protein
MTSGVCKWGLKRAVSTDSKQNKNPYVSRVHSKETMFQAETHSKKHTRCVSLAMFHWICFFVITHIANLIWTE